MLYGSDQKVLKYQSEEEKSPSHFICTESGFMPYIPCNAGVACWLAPVLSAVVSIQVHTRFFRYCIQETAIVKIHVAF